MKWLALIAALVVAGCESQPSQPQAAAEPDMATKTETTAAPRGLPEPPPEQFGALTTDLDRVVLTERTKLVLDDAGMPTGDQAHPPAYETTDPEWISRFAAAVGRSTTKSDLPENCEPWADLTLYAGDEVVASMSVDCSANQVFSTFKVRGETRGYTAADTDAAAELLDRLRAE